MVSMLAILLLFFILSADAVDYVYLLDCSSGNCGSGGDYAVRQTAPVAGPYSDDPQVNCSLGDTITFTISDPASFQFHPMSFVTGVVNTYSPPYRGNTTSAPMVPGSPLPVSMSITCDNTLLAAQATGVFYICYYHDGMGGRISMTAGTDAPTTASPTSIPTETPTTNAPTTKAPTTAPTPASTRAPTETPTQFPTAEGATFAPTIAPTSEPTESPTETPTEEPTEQPTPFPTAPQTTPAPTADPVNYVYELDCSLGNCGSGGDYSVRQISPQTTAFSHDPDINCALGDSITFLINDINVLRPHPVAIVTTAVLTSSPIYTGNVSGNPMIPSLGAPRSLTVYCDERLLAAQSGSGVYYICLLHDAMGAKITMISSVPTLAPTDNDSPTDSPPPTDTMPPLSAPTFPPFSPRPPITFDPIDPGARLYSYECDLDNGVKFRWNRVNRTTNVFEFSVSAPTLGWVGVGFHEKFLMLEADAYLGWVRNDSRVQSITAYMHTRGVDALASNPALGAYAFAGSEVNGETIMEYSRDIGSGFHPVTLGAKRALEDDTIIVFAAYSNIDGPIEFKHTVFPLYAQVINVDTGDSYPIKKEVTTLHYVHAVVCAVAFGFLFPLGVMFARYGKPMDVDIFGKRIWFIIHMVLQVVTLIIGIGGIVVGFFLPVSAGMHMKTLFHGQLGCAVLVVAILQVIVGFIRPDIKPEREKKTTARKVWEFIHHWTGRLLLIMSIAQIIAGILQISYDYWPFAIYLPYLIILFIVLIALEVNKCMNEARDVERV